ncbi:hypothetical protein IJ670_08645, partial [bacterium]|nr:hypothetical protein [bacterium]
MYFNKLKIFLIALIPTLALVVLFWAFLPNFLFNSVVKNALYNQTGLKYEFKNSKANMDLKLNFSLKADSL